MKFVKIFGFKVFSDNLDLIDLSSSDNQLLTTISPNSYGITTKDFLFKSALQNSDFLVLDGVYFALAPILLMGKNIKNNQGPNVFFHFMNRLNSMGGKAFFLGSNQSTLEKIKLKSNISYPNIVINGYSPPFKEEFSEEDNNSMIDAINKFNPNVLFVGMTCPKQEKWGFQNKNKLNTQLICCIGGVFDWYAGNQKIIAPFWWKFRLAWLKRMIDRPEIFKRNMPNVCIFFWHLFLAVLRIKKF